MIIFGLRTMVKLLATVNLVCGNCHNPAAQQVIRRMRWFTLFFIPVFPVSVSRSMTCTYCGVTTKLAKDDADRLAAGPGTPAPTSQQPGWPQQQPPSQQPGQWQQGPS